MTRKFLSAVAVLSAVLALQSQASAQLTDTDTQLFRVNVPQNVTITAQGAAPALAAYTPTAVGFNPLANLPFAPQPWEVKGNVRNGVNVNFRTTQAFTHTIDNTWRRDARLGLQVASTNGPGAWNITQASDTTNYGGGDGEAIVAATSNGVGRATFNLQVDVITVEFGTFAAGDYETTVVGTVTENP